MHGTILVVDDDADVRESTRLVLSRQGYEVWLAPDGNSAIQLMNQPVLASAVCTVLCDLGMPNGNGTELITYLRHHHPAIPVVVCSGTDDTVFLNGILQQGVCDWLRKPVSRETLLQKVRTAVHLFTLRRSQDMDVGPISTRPRVTAPGVEGFEKSKNSATWS